MMHDLTSIAREVVQRFFDEQVPLNDLISLTAQDLNLNEHMIRRLCEMANTETRQHLFKQPGINQAAALFEPADATQVIIIKQKPSVSPSSMDYMLSPSQYLPEQQAPVIEIVIKQDDEKEMRKLKREENEKRANVVLRYSDYVEARNQFLKETKNYFREGHDAIDINKMAAFVDEQATLKAIMPHMKDYFGKVGLQKTASEIDDLLNNKLSVTYVYGANPIVLKYQECVLTSSHLLDSIVELEGVVQKQAGIGTVLAKGISKVAPLVRKAAPGVKKFFTPGGVKGGAAGAVKGGAAGITEGSVAANAVQKGIKDVGGNITQKATFSINPLKWQTGTKVMAGLGVGMGGFGMYGDYQKNKELQKYEKDIQKDFQYATGFDKPSMHEQKPAPKTQYEEDVDKDGMLSAGMNEFNRQRRDEFLRQSKGTKPLIAAKQEVGTYGKSLWR